MPLAQITTNVDVPESRVLTLLADVSRALADCFGKPERWVMTCMHPRALLTFGGSVEPAAYIEVKNIGTMGSAKASEVAAVVTQAVTERLGVPSDRVYIELCDASAERWAYDGATFG